jgi:plasmid maintenance system antidote protein VapI
MLNEEFLKRLALKANAFAKAIEVPMARGALFGNDRSTVQNVMK